MLAAAVARWQTGVAARARAGELGLASGEHCERGESGERAHRRALLRKARAPRGGPHHGSDAASRRHSRDEAVTRIAIAARIASSSWTPGPATP
ncbi:hypothetical protein DB32_006645 [Sandaracinus amylolyticus]|uniref:Uncharacterized protein n=1 Tax=Sandaracinus amylolyticus TaxID=927083 RepID=A0A0F6W7U1_9BACT|nr:hypothetical protein DB32_006645 [Sandaracinus amylolyticus]